MRIGGGGGPGNRFQGQIDDVRVYGAVLSPKQGGVLANGESIAEIAGVAPEKRSESQTEKIALYFLENHAPAAIQQAWRALLAARQEKAQFVESLPTVMVMQERDTPAIHSCCFAAHTTGPATKSRRECRPFCLHCRKGPPITG
jgi:hypothetical protein